MENRIQAGPDVVLVIDDVERQKWESIGVVGERAQGKVFQAMARAVENLTRSSDVAWSPASNLPVDEDELRARYR